MGTAPFYTRSESGPPTIVFCLQVENWAPFTRGSMSCVKDWLAPTVLGRLVFRHVGSKNEVVEAVEVGWKAVIPLWIIPHLDPIGKQKQQAENHDQEHWFLPFAQMNASVTHT